MHINQLPLELLQEILSYLSFDEQLNILSIVCHHWLRAVETFIVHKGRYLITKQVLQNCDIVQSPIRCYKVLYIPAVQDWIGLRLVVLKCMRAFPGASELYVDGFPQNLLTRFYTAYRNWEAEQRQLGNDDKICETDACIESLPDITRLIWIDCLEYNGAHKPIIEEDQTLEDCADVQPEVRCGLKRKSDSNIE